MHGRYEMPNVRLGSKADIRLTWARCTSHSHNAQNVWYGFLSKFEVGYREMNDA